MSLHEAGVIAGSVSTVLFVSSYLPMLVKAARTRDLRSYSPGNLVVANVGNLVHTLYVLSLPAGPLWALHGFYLVSTAVMLFWWWRYRERSAAEAPSASIVAPHEESPAEDAGLALAGLAGRGVSQ